MNANTFVWFVIVCLVIAPAIVIISRHISGVYYHNLYRKMGLIGRID